MSLFPGPSTFSHDRLRKVWRAHQVVRGQYRYELYKDIAYRKHYTLEAPGAARKFCLELLSSVQEPRNHLSMLDQRFEFLDATYFYKTNLSEEVVSSLPQLRIAYCMREGKRRCALVMSLYFGVQIIEEASRLLTQLPATAPDILDALPFNIDPLHDYGKPFVEGESTRSNASADAPVSNWERLRVVHYVGDYILRHALHTALFKLEPKIRPLPIPEVIDSVLLLLHLSIQLSAEEHAQDGKWLIVCAFLWTTWQRSITIHLWTCLSEQLSGFDYMSSKLQREGLGLIPTIFASRNQQLLEELRRIPYLCGWSFQSLQKDRANVAMDLRYFHKLYRAQFGERRAICSHNASQCDGRSSLGCRRFKDTRAENQSMHDFRCQAPCRRLFWSRDSFTNILGPRAVDIVNTSPGIIRYCKVSESTLTVSHVWSHGQGGRPDNVGSEGSGFNLCLHRRYTELARSLGCNSYWMDTSCIPSETELRRECISQITAIFASSGKTVICDRDIMTIDISGSTMVAYESVLATLLVCDWGIRAWTLLEAIRGRRGLFVLCRHNKLINLHELLKLVHNDGRMDLVNLCLARDYLFPPPDISAFEFFDIPVADVERETAAGFVDIGTAIALLSHRHATRDGDDLLIWSLLIGDIEDESPIAMWRRQVGKTIQTGSLVSSAQRVQGHPGLGWAPFTPTAMRRSSEQNTDSGVYPARADMSISGLITTEGLRAMWLIHVFPVVMAASVDQRTMRGHGPPEPFVGIAEQYLRGYKWGALLQKMKRPKGPVSNPITYHTSLGRIVVVCGSHDESVWEWKGIYDWDASIALPPFERREILII